MPALYTHYKFGQDVLNNLDNNLKEKINKNIAYYNMFNQGFDNLYYYFKWSYYRKFGIKAHKTNIDLFFTNIFNFIKENNLENNSIVTNVIYGFINHYTLDTILHPFINYQVKNLNIPHTKIEFMLDYYLISLKNKKWKSNIYNTLIPRLKFDNDLINLLDYTFLNTYNIENIGKIFNRSHNNGYYIYRYFITDIHNIKTKFYKIIDLILHNEDIKLSENTFTKTIDLRILNSDKLVWHHPNNKKETYNYSFQELYDYSLNICIYLCNIANDVLNNNLKTEKFINLITKIDLKNIQEFPTK